MDQRLRNPREASLNAPKRARRKRRSKRNPTLRFVLHTLVNTIVFLCIASAAVTADLLVHSWRANGVSWYLCALLEGSALLLAAIDLVAFFARQRLLMNQFRTRRRRRRRP